MTMNGLPKDRLEVLNLINEWNSTRLDLFKISEPNEVLDFYGVMRFYFQDAEDKVTTKCIRVASTATSLDVIRVLMEKLRPDMKTLPNEKDFCIYEVHPNGGLMRKIKISNFFFSFF
jgi:afadin